MTTVEPHIGRLDFQSNGIELTPWEFDAAEFEPGYSYELVNGVLIVNPPPKLEERDPNEELGHWLRTYQRDHRQGSALDLTISEHTIHVGPHRRRVDRAIWAGLGRLPNKTETPTVAIEFVSEGRRNHQRDCEIKRDEYRSAGVKQYWVIDRFKRFMTVFEFAGNQVTMTEVSEQQTYSTDLLPGFELPLATLLELADRWVE